MTLFEDLGVDPAEAKWEDFAACKGLDSDLFFDLYENDEIIAKNIDECCLSCPVIKACYQVGTKTRQHGTWGGFFLLDGKVDRSKNKHKTKEVVKALEAEL